MLYKDSNNQLHDDMDGAATHLLPTGCTIATPEEIDIIRNPPKTPEQLALEKLAVLNRGRELREKILARLNGIHVAAIYNNDVPPVIAAIMVSKQQLLDITIWPAVVSAVTAAETEAAIVLRYYEIAAELQLSAPTAVSAFTGLDL